MAVDDYVGISVVGRYQMQNIVNTMHYKITEQVAGENTILYSLCEAWVTALETPWVARHIDTYTLEGLRAFSKSGSNKRPGILSLGTSGAVVGSEVSSPLCRVITMYTDADNYRKRGRVMLSGCDTTMFNDDDGAVSAAEITALGALEGLLVGDIDNAGDTFSPYLLPVGEDPGESIVSALARKTPALIRSRRVRGFTIG